MLNIRDKLSASAQEVYAGWFPEPDDTNGICDAVAVAMWGVVCDELPDAAVEEGGHDGDDHAWLIVTVNNEKFGVDIPADLYETGGGYNWQKRADVQFRPEDVSVFQL